MPWHVQLYQSIFYTLKLFVSSHYLHCRPRLACMHCLLTLPSAILLAWWSHLIKLGQRKEKLTLGFYTWDPQCGGSECRGWGGGQRQHLFELGLILGFSLAFQKCLCWKPICMHGSVC